jgi:gag-polypeptide of LTR copia-type
MSTQTSDKLTSILLDGKNYNIWVRQATFGLIGRDKLEFVNGEATIPVPVTPENPIEDEKRAIREWRKNDNRVAASNHGTTHSQNHDLSEHCSTDVE